MRHEILAHSVAFLAVCIGASCTTPQGTGSATSSAQEPPPPVLVKWDDLPIELKKASVPPYSAISYCAVRASSQGSDAEAVKADLDRKSTRLNSSDQIISYAVFCLKKKKKKPI